MMEKQNRVVFLKGKKVILRPLRKETDLAAYVRWFNDPEIRYYTFGWRPLTYQAESDRFDEMEKNKEDIRVAIETLDGKLIGTMGLHQIDRNSGVATTGAVIGEKEYWSRGYGTDAKMILLNHAFNEMNLRKICSWVWSFNGRSRRYNDKCGYIIEGIRKKQIFKHGRYWDQILMAVFKQDWLPIWKRYYEE